LKKTRSASRNSITPVLSPMVFLQFNPAQRAIKALVDTSVYVSLGCSNGECVI